MVVDGLDGDARLTEFKDRLRANTEIERSLAVAINPEGNTAVLQFERSRDAEPEDGSPVTALVDEMLAPGLVLDVPMAHEWTKWPNERIALYMLDKLPWAAYTDFFEEVVKESIVLNGETEPVDPGSVQLLCKSVHNVVERRLKKWRG